MPLDESPNTEENYLKMLNAQGSRQQLDQLEALHLEHSALGALIREKQVHLMRCCLEAWKIWKEECDEEE